MSKPVKSLIEKELATKFKDVENVAENNLIRRHLHEKGLKMTVVKNSLAVRATAGSKLKGFEPLLDGPCAVIYGKASVSAIARLLLDEKKTEDKLELRGVFFDGEIYAGEDGVKRVSKFPTREEAVGLIVAAALSPGKKLAGVFKGQASKIASILKTIEEKAKEKEAAAPVAAAEVPPEAPPAAPAPSA